MKRISLLSICLLFVLFITNAQISESIAQESPSNGWKSLVEHNYSIHYPDNWELDQSGHMGMSFILLSPLSSDQDLFRENINLMIQDLSGHNLDLDAYTALSEGQIKTMFVHGNLIESKRLKTETLDYHKVMYTGKQGIYNLKFVQYYWVVDDTAYILTFTCEESTFSEYLENGEKILNSFVLGLH